MDVGKKAPCSAKTAPSWPNEDDTWSKRLELAHRRFLLLVSEIPAVFEYIDFEDRRTAFEPRESGGIRRVWAVE